MPNLVPRQIQPHPSRDVLDAARISGTCPQYRRTTTATGDGVHSVPPTKARPALAHRIVHTMRCITPSAPRPRPSYRDDIGAFPLPAAKTYRPGMEFTPSPQPKRIRPSPAHRSPDALKLLFTPSEAQGFSPGFHFAPLRGTHPSRDVFDAACIGAVPHPSATHIATDATQQEPTAGGRPQPSPQQQPDARPPNDRKTKNPSRSATKPKRNRERSDLPTASQA